jgi:mannitol-1-phosphate 5-dehydrogenase
MKMFVQYGAGNIGRGFIGALFSNAGYNVEFIDVNMEVINALNERKQYPVRIVAKKGNHQMQIKNVCGIDGRDSLLVAQAIAGADIMATAVGVNILPRIVPNIVEGLRLRFKSNNINPLNIIICENLIDADKLLAKLINEQLNDAEKAQFNDYVGLVEASIGRMVPVMTEEMKRSDNLLVCVEKYCMLPIDKAAFKGKIPEIPELYPYSPFEYFIRRKLFIHNMGHALAAYMGHIEGFTYIWQAIENPYIKLLTQRAMIESAKALSKHFEVPLAAIMEQIDDLLLRFSNAELGDTVDRVGRDLKRKLSSSDRLAGAVKLCQAEGVEAVYICAGIAAGLFFESQDDQGTQFVKEMLKSKGVVPVLNEICGLDADEKEKEYIKSYYELLKTGATIKELLLMCEEFEEEAIALKNIV